MHYTLQRYEMSEVCCLHELNANKGASGRKLDAFSIPNVSFENKILFSFIF